MFSKKKISKTLSIFVVTLLSLLFVSSCGLKLGEKAPDTEVAKVESADCLNRSIEDLKVFFDGKAKDVQVDLAFQCLSKVLIAFKDNIQGVNKDRFLPQELAYFVETNFLKDEKKFSTGFLEEIMQLKRVLIGGSVDYFKKEEILKLSELIDRVRPEVVQLNPEMQVLVGDWDHSQLTAGEKENQFQKSKQKAVRFFISLSAELARQGTSYEVANLFNFIKETAQFAGASTDSIKKIQKTKSFLINFKKHLVGEGTIIRPADWSKVSQSLHEFLFQILRIKYFLDPLQEGQDVERWSVYQNITLDMTQLLSTLLSTQKKPMLTNDQIYDLVASVLPIFSDKNIDEEIINYFADIKIALIGENNSDKSKWVPSDLDRIRNKIPDIFKEIRTLTTILDHFNLQRKSGMAYADFNKYEKDFNKSVANMVFLFEGSYDLASLKQLVLNLKKNDLLGGFELPDKFESYYKLLLSAKYVVLGKQGSQVANSELKHVLKLLGKGYFHFIEYKDYLEKAQAHSKDFFESFKNLIPKVRTTLDIVLNSKSSKAINSNEILSFYYTLQNEKLIDSEITLDSVSLVLEQFWSHILIKPANRLAKKKLPGINSEALDVVQAELNLYNQAGLDIQDVLANLPATANGQLTQANLLKALQSKLNKSTNSIQIQALKQLIRALYGPVPLVRDDRDYLKILAAQSLYKESDIFNSLFSLTASRLLIRSYAQELPRVEGLTGVTLLEVQNFYEPIKKLFFELELISPDNTTFVNSRYREANLFISRANGDYYANFEEVHDLFIHIFSGLKRAETLRNNIVQVCLPPQNTPVTSETIVDETCVLNHYFKTTLGFESMPEFIKMKTVFSEEQNKQYYYSLLKAAGHVPNDKQNAKFEDLNLFPHVVQYLEVIFARYDTNRNGLLEKGEALTAFPVFKSTIKEVLKTISGGDLITEDKYPGVFIYLLKYGRPPKGMLEKLQFMGFIGDESKWNIQSTRLDLGTIFNFIAESLSSSNITPTSP